MFILEIGNKNICFIDNENKTLSKINLDKDIIDQGDMINIPEIFSIIKNKIDINHEKEITFILNSKKILSKEVKYPISSKSKLKVLIGLSVKEHFNELNNEEYIYSYEILEKTRVLIFAVPKKIIDWCFLLAQKLEMQIKLIDYGDNVLIQYIKSISESRTNLLINIKEDVTVISILKNGILKLQSTINSGEAMSLISSASRIIKYYSDKNNKEHINKIFFFDKQKIIEKLPEEISEKMLLEVEVIDESLLYGQTMKQGLLNFAENSEIKDKGISRYFSIYRLAVIFSIGILLYFIAPPTLDYFYAVSEKKVIQGDFDAIEDIIDIMKEKEISKSKLESAEIYEAIVNVLPNDAYEISVESNQEKVIVNGIYKTQIDEEAIKNIWEDSLIVINSENNTFEIQSILGGEKD